MFRGIANKIGEYVMRASFPARWYGTAQPPHEALASSIYEKLSSKIANSQVTVDSGGDGYHFLIQVISPVFEGMPRVKQHLLVSDIIKEELKQIHAVTIRTHVPKSNS